MRPGEMFEDLLEARIREVSAPTHEVGRVRSAPATAYGFFFAAEPLPTSATQSCGRVTPAGRVPDSRHAGAVAASKTDPCSSERTILSEASPRPGRRLGLRQQRALADLIALGAALREDFSSAELRSAFRSLARRYHPDRHAGSGDAERVRLARQFARVHDAYRLLAES